MAPLQFLEVYDRDVANTNVPVGGQVMSVVISLAATTVLTLFLTQRFLAIRVWSRLPFVVWLVFAIYIDSYAFVFATGILQHSFGVNSSFHICEGAILLCLVCYVTTKASRAPPLAWKTSVLILEQIFIYLFLVEKAYIIRGTTKRRMHSRLYLFNSFGMLSVYIVVVTLNFILMESGQCIIGMKSVAMIPLISFDAVVNVYLTIIFLIPLKNLYSFKNMARTPANLRLRSVAFRTFFGAVCTLISSITNLSVLMAVNGEPGWVCLMCCNCDILFSAVVIQWVTSKDNAGTSSTSSSHHLEPQPPTQTPTRRTPFDNTDPAPTPPSPAEQALVPQPPSTHDRPKPPGAVVITTTIKRESIPNHRNMYYNNSNASDEEVDGGSDIYDDNAEQGAGGASQRDESGCRGPRRMSCGPLGAEGVVSSTTMIMGGRRGHHHH